MTMQQFYDPSTEFRSVSEFDLEKAPRHIYWAVKFAIIILGWSLEYYYYYAVYTGGYETTGLWGVQGSGKSNRMLQHLFWIYRFDYILEMKYVDMDYNYIPRWTPFLNNPDKTAYFTSKCREIIDYKLLPSENIEIWRRVLKSLVLKPNLLLEKLESVPEGDVLRGLVCEDIASH